MESCETPQSRSYREDNLMDSPFMERLLSFPCSGEIPGQLTSTTLVPDLQLWTPASDIFQLDNLGPGFEFMFRDSDGGHKSKEIMEPNASFVNLPSPNLFSYTPPPG